MPLFHHTILTSDVTIGLWQIEESEGFFRDQLNLTEAQALQLERMRGTRRREWLANRFLVDELLGKDAHRSIWKNKNGKPYFMDSDTRISFSHSGQLTAVMLDQKKEARAIGIDIQQISPRIEKLAFKFMRDEEMESVQEEAIAHLHTYWGAKESLYKTLGIPKVYFKENIHIQPFSYSIYGGDCQGAIEWGGQKQYFDLQYNRWRDYVLVSAMERPEA